MPVNTSLMPLHAEQLTMQRSTIRERNLDAYDVEIFPSERSSVADFLGALASGASSMVELLYHLSGQTQDRAFGWTDMAGGFGVALREASQLHHEGLLGEVALTNVDLFDWRKEVPEDELKFIDDILIGADPDDPDARPQLITDNIETVTLPESSDLITCVEAVQYLSDPLRALVNWYNQLHKDGVMVVVRKYMPWSANITQEGSIQSAQPFADLFAQLRGLGVAYATDLYSSDSPMVAAKERHGFESLVIQRKEDTRLQLNASVVDVTKSFYKKSVRYDSARPAIEAITI